MDAKGVLTDAFGRLPELVHLAVDDLTPDQLRWRPADEANSIGWLVWHLTRVQDDHVADVMGAEQVYATGDWAPRFGLKDTTETGYGHDASRVASVAPESAQVLLDYFEAVNDRTLGYLAGLRDDDLDRIVDTNWDPPVTLGTRLVSVYDDDAQHAGQAAYVRGLL
ncbi:mycothiol transferase [Actinoplanes solisilvae]|uniref:mycothiol transferase n=1 Tax=Actinoplanes solisilvae TaxID=2486853 RepID=UPI000FD7D685|nr:DinB family protein [Actinoplanes solisilvae]